MVGWVRFKVRHVYTGQKIELHHAEILNKDGSFYNGNLRKAKQKNSVYSKRRGRGNV
ncbi:family 78 glycoside hydrolase catalytic domain [Bacillus pacificus]